VRPFFLTPDGTKPTPNKRYYDILSWVVTQFTLGFAVLPFIFLGFNDSILVWSRVYFYGIIGTAASLASFASFSPVKAYLVGQLKRRNRPHVPRTMSQETVRPPTLGLPNDPERDFDEAVAEIKAEIESRRRRGSVVTMPTGEELKIAVEQRIGRKL
jgi:lysophospholipid acyltransferase